MKARIESYEYNLCGTVTAIPSKSHLHRLLIAAALGNAPVEFPYRGMSNDIRATMNCLRTLGAKVVHEYSLWGGYNGQVDTRRNVLKVFPVRDDVKKKAVLDPGESGSTYRFFTPLAAALGVETRFCLHGKLPTRPMAPLWNEMEAHGVTITGKGTDSPVLSGKLTPGEYRLPGNVSSQFFTGLLFALPLLDGDSRITIEGKLESVGYIDMTLEVLDFFHIKIEQGEGYFVVPGNQKYILPEALTMYDSAPEDVRAENKPPVRIRPEGDWSNSAFWLCAGAAGGGLTVDGLMPPQQTCQGDSAVVGILRRFGAEVKEACDAVKTSKLTDLADTLDGKMLWHDEGDWSPDDFVIPDSVTVKPAPLHGITIDVSNVPDLVPALAVAAMAAKGRTVFTNAGRLRLKESDRIASVCAAVNALGGKAWAEGDSLIIAGGERPRGGTVDACGDHRIVMLAAAAAPWCIGLVTILGAEAVNKSYPNFWRDYASLGGHVTLYEED